MHMSDHEGMVPVLESQMALAFLASYGQDRRIETTISTMAQRVRKIVPECIALSLGMVQEELTFTLVSETREIALLDALQYLDDGPCVSAAREAQPRESRQGVDEDKWQLFARGQTVAGVASTLSLPMMSDGRVTCGVNLYASTPDAFDGHHDELAAACGAWAQGVVTNADLSFTSRLRAAAAPTRLREKAFVDSAVGFIAAHQSVDMETAASRIRQAAARAGVSEADVAKFILDSNPSVGT
jgi:hypothetical protein